MKKSGTKPPAKEFILNGSTEDEILYEGPRVSARKTKASVQPKAFKFENT